MIPQHQVDIYKPTIRTIHRLALGVTELYFSIHRLERTHKLTIVATDPAMIMAIREDLFGSEGLSAEQTLGIDVDEVGNICRVYGARQAYEVIDDPLREGMEWQGGA